MTTRGSADSSSPSSTCYADTDPDLAAIEAIWEPLAARLDVHAAAEEEIFYPQLLAPR